MTDQFFTDEHGIKWLNRGEHTDDHLAHGGHETYLVGLIREMVPDGGIFLDVGAHVGLYTLNLMDKAYVTAIEANPETFDALGLNIANNTERVTHGVSKYCVAAWDEETTLYGEDPNERITGGSTRFIEGNGDRDDGVKAKPLDTVLQAPHYRPHVVKMDVEGAEAHVLRGLVQTINTARPTLLIEMHDMYYGEQVRTEVLQFLESNNYLWNDDLTFSVGYYVLATPFEKTKAFEGEVVHAGDSGLVDEDEALAALLKGQS